MSNARRTVNGLNPVQSNACVCPECGSIAIVRKSPAFPEHRTYPEDYRCRNCDAHFDHDDIVVNAPSDDDDLRDRRPRQSNGRFRERADVTPDDAQDDEDTSPAYTPEDIADASGVDPSVVRMALGDAFEDDDT